MPQPLECVNVVFFYSIKITAPERTTAQSLANKYEYNGADLKDITFTQSYSILLTDAVYKCINVQSKTIYNSGKKCWIDIKMMSTVDVN